MTHTFKHPLWDRLVTVDENGIHEQRRGRVFASIPWDELESLLGNTAYSQRDTGISPCLFSHGHSRFAQCVSEMWKERHPDRWRRNRERARQAANVKAYVSMPLRMFTPSILLYFFFWRMGSSEEDQLRMQVVHGLTAIAFVVVVGRLLWHRRKMRKGFY